MCLTSKRWLVLTDVADGIGVIIKIWPICQIWSHFNVWRKGQHTHNQILFNFFIYNQTIYFEL